MVTNKATDEELNALIAAAESAGVGKGDLQAVVLGAFDFSTNGKHKPMDRLTSKQCQSLTQMLLNKAAERKYQR